MSSTRIIMAGLEDLHGVTTANGLHVERMHMRQPLSWIVRCTRCKSSWAELHISVRHAPCRNANCHLERERAQAKQARERYRPTRYPDSDAAQRAADPDSLRRQLNYERERRK